MIRRLLAAVAIAGLLVQPAAAANRKPIVRDPTTGQYEQIQSGDTLVDPTGTAYSTGGGGGTPGGTNGQPQYNCSGLFCGFTMGGDATLNTSTGAITVLKTNGVSFTYFATGTDAANLTGTVSVNRFNGGTNADSAHYLRGDGTWASAGTVTSITAGAGLTGGTIATSGTIALDLTHANSWSGKQDLGGGGDLTPAATPNTNALGYLGAPIDEQDASYTFVMADAGETVRHNSATAHTYTIPAHGSVALPVGTVIPVRNSVASGVLTITPSGGVSLYQAGGTTSGAIALQAGAFVTLMQEASDSWVATGIQSAQCSLLQTITTSGSATSETFSSFSSAFQDLSLRVRGRGTKSAGNTSIEVQFNGDTGSDYDRLDLEYTSAGASFGQVLAGTFLTIGYLAAASAPSNVGDGIDALLFAYNGSTFQKALTARSTLKTANTSGNLYVMSTSGWWRSTSAITSIKVFPDSNAFVDGTVLTLTGCNG